MAREWSRRSIEEIARKIGKDLGGLSINGTYDDVITTPYPSETTQNRAFYYSVSDNHIEQLENGNMIYYPYAEIRIEKWKEGFVSGNKAYLGPLPWNDYGYPEGVGAPLQADSTKPYDVYLIVEAGGDYRNHPLTHANIIQKIANGEPVYNLTRDYTTHQLYYRTTWITNTFFTVGGNTMYFPMQVLILEGDQASTVFNEVKSYLASHYNWVAYLLMVKRETE